jgi:type II secretory ATPase GspE/PulE/Tfp pilus assembly ATPase PilB-like protein
MPFVRAILRQDPDIVLVGEIRDVENRARPPSRPR